MKRNRDYEIRKDPIREKKTTTNLRDCHRKIFNEKEWLFQTIDCDYWTKTQEDFEVEKKFSILNYISLRKNDCTKLSSLDRI